MNIVTLIGRLTRDPELRFTPGTGTGVTTVRQVKKGLTLYK